MIQKLCIILIFISVKVYGQQNVQFEEGKIWVKINNSDCEKSETTWTNNNAFNLFLDSNNTTNYTQPFWFAKSEKLKKIYEISCDCDENEVFSQLNERSDLNYLFDYIEKVPKPIALYDPVDYMWQLQISGAQDWMWHLDLIDASNAWDITRGDPNLKVAIIDNGFDILHPDLATKIDPPYDFYSGNALPVQTHGTATAGLFAGETVETGGTELGQTASIGFNTKVMAAGWGNGVVKATYASTVLGAKVISISWFNSCSPSQSAIDAEEEILNNGTTIVKAAGNEIDVETDAHHCNNNPLYPFSGVEDPRTIVVSGTWKNDNHLHEKEENGVMYPWSHNDYPAVDLCAPSYEIMVPLKTDGGTSPWPYGTGNGTSHSAPIVAGVAALMYSVNPCLTSSSCQNILKNTTDPIVDAANYPGTIGTGRVNAFEAVKAAQAAHSNTFDLYIKDRNEDFGVSGGYSANLPRANSPDIWVRNRPDGLTNQEHQEPEYKVGQPVYVYVRVRNKSCIDATTNYPVSLYWSKASSWSSWPQNWDGSSPTVGNKIGTKIVASSTAGGETILQFEWNILNPYVHDNWATCLLARIENSDIDPTIVHPDRLDKDVYYNNNVAQKNITIVDVISGNQPVIDGIKRPYGKFMYIGNPTEQTETYDFKFTVPEDIKGDPITDAAEMQIIFDLEGWNLIKDKVQLRNDVKVHKEKVIIPIDQTFWIDNVRFPKLTRVPVYVGFSFLSKKVGDKNEFNYQINQYLSEDNSLLGEEHFVVRKHKRNDFDADAGDNKKIKKNDNITVSATDIAETATYNWYNEAGDLIYTGKDLAVSPQITKKYKLEVIASADGFKDYDEVVVEVKDCYINSVSPNPASSNVMVDYKTENTTSAYVMVLNATATTNNNYIIDVNQTQTTFNVANFQQGTYSVILVCDGVAVDMKTLIVQ